MIEFWERYPALLIGIFIFLGAHLACDFTWQRAGLTLIPFTFLCYRFRLSTLVALLCGLGAYFYASSTSSIIKEEGLWRGIAKVEVVEIKEEMKFGKPLTKIKLFIEDFRGDRELKKITASLIWKSKRTRPSGGFLYEVPGSLKKGEGPWLSFQTKECDWKVLEQRTSLVEWRFWMKERLHHYMDEVLPSGPARTFLEGLFLGEFHDPVLAENLRRFGLSHIMVVSGFHFSLMVAFLAFFLRFTLPWRSSLIGLIIGATFYLLFIGPSASVMRAWISVSVLLVGKVFEKRASGLNSLGVGLIVLLLYEPVWSESLGFQLSFLATFAILLFYPVCDDFLSKVFKTRSYSEVIEMTRLDQLCYILLIFFRKSLSLSFAVNILMLPMSLYYFHQFPLLSIFYNLFFPLVTSLCLFLLCFALFLYWIPGLSTALFCLTHQLTTLLLKPVNFLPHSFDLTIRVPEISALWLVSVLCVSIWAGILLSNKQDNEKNWLFSYV